MKSGISLIKQKFKNVSINFIIYSLLYTCIWLLSHNVFASESFKVFTKCIFLITKIIRCFMHISIFHHSIGKSTWEIVSLWKWGKSSILDFGFPPSNNFYRYNFVGSIFMCWYLPFFVMYNPIAYNQERLWINQLSKGIVCKI